MRSPRGAGCRGPAKLRGDKGYDALFESRTYGGPGRAYSVSRTSGRACFPFRFCGLEADGVQVKRGVTYMNRQRIVHPKLGAIPLYCQTPVGPDPVTVTAGVHRDTWHREDHDKLRLLSAIGSQRLAT